VPTNSYKHTTPTCIGNLYRKHLIDNWKNSFAEYFCMQFKWNTATHIKYILVLFLTFMQRTVTFSITSNQIKYTKYLEILFLTYQTVLILSSNFINKVIWELGIAITKSDWLLWVGFQIYINLIYFLKTSGRNKFHHLSMNYS